MQYISSQDLYLGKYFTFSLDELIKYDQLEPTQKQYTHSQLLGFFPEAKQLLMRQVKNELASQKEKLKTLQLKEFYLIDEVRKLLPEIRWFWIMVLRVFYSDEIEKLEKAIKRNIFFLSFKKDQPHNGSITPKDIEYAKLVPIEEYYDGKLRKYGSRALGICPFHEERTASFTIFTNQNRWYCFGCSDGGDSIDFLTRKYNLNFIEAVKRLCQKLMT